MPFIADIAVKCKKRGSRLDCEGLSILPRGWSTPVLLIALCYPLVTGVGVWVKVNTSGVAGLVPVA